MIELSKSVPGLMKNIKFTMKSTCFEDNAACLALARLKKITAQNRHIAVKYHWFRSHVLGSRHEDAYLDIVKVDSKDQQGDGFTKNLTADNFVAWRKLLCNW